MIHTILTIFGLAVAVRTLNFLSDRGVLALKVSGKVFFLIAYGISTYFLSDILLWIVTIMCIFLPIAVVQLQIKFRRNIVKGEFASILETLIVEMKSGKAFREAVKSYLDCSEGYKKSVLNEFLCPLLQQEQNSTRYFDLKTATFFEELLRIERSSSRVIDRLVSLRHKIRTEHEFKIKVRRAMLQTKAQALVVAILYILLLTYSASVYEWNLLKPFVLISGVFFILGVIVLLNIGSRFKWKI